MRAALSARMVHADYCHGTAHHDCCGVSECDCNVADSLDTLLPYTARQMRKYAAMHLRAAAEWQREPGGWLTGRALDMHDWLKGRADALDPPGVR